VLPPGPTRSPLANLRRFVRDPYGVFWDAAAEFGPVFSFRIANQPAWISIGEPALIERVFRGGDDFFAASQAGGPTLPPGTLLEPDEQEQPALLDESSVAAHVDAAIELLRPGQRVRASELLTTIMIGRARMFGRLEAEAEHLRTRVRPFAAFIRRGGPGDSTDVELHGPALTLAWTLWLLSGHRVQREQVLDEARDPAGGWRMTEAVIDETMRLRPIAHHTARRLARPLQLGDWSLPAGTATLPSQVVTHFRADLWDSPHEFRPERFSSASEPSPFVYFPFGASQAKTRRARQRMRVILQRLLQRVDLRVAIDADPRPAMCGALLGPSDGVPIIIETIRS
jgi:cytochrome P450